MRIIIVFHMLFLLSSLAVSNWVIGPYSPCEYTCDGYTRNIEITCEGRCSDPPPEVDKSFIVKPKLYNFELGNGIRQEQAYTRSVFFPNLLGDATDRYGDNEDWKYNSGPTDSVNTGPFFDHTYQNESGHYFHIESSAPVGVGEIWMDSPLLIVSDVNNKENCYISFYLHGRGLKKHLTGLKIQTVQCDNITDTHLITEYSSSDPDIPSDYWVYKAVRIPFLTEKNIRIRFSALHKRLLHNAMDWAIDDVQFSTGCFPPSPSPSPTHTASATHTPSPTASATHTSTHTPSSSFSCTPSASRSPSSSPTTTTSATHSSSSSPTHSPSISRSPSSSPTHSPTSSPSATHSSSLSHTHSPSLTATHSLSSSLSSTSSSSATHSPSLTATHSLSSSATYSPSATHSPSSSATHSPSLSCSPSSTSSLTPTPSLSSTYTSSTTLSPSFSPSPSDSQPLITNKGNISSPFRPNGITISTSSNDNKKNILQIIVIILAIVLIIRFLYNYYRGRWS